MSIPKANKYILDFEQLGFGMFIHWGLYSQLGRGEWVFFKENYDMKEYKKLSDTFASGSYGQLIGIRALQGKKMRKTQ